MQSLLSNCVGLFISCSLTVTCYTQNKPVADTTKPMRISAQTQRPGNGPRPYSELITSEAITDHGFIKVHKVGERYYFDIADSLLGRDILVVNRIGKSAAESRVQSQGYAGDQIGEKVLRFEKGPGNKLFLRKISFREMSSDTSENGMYRSVINSNLQPIVSSFDVKAFGKDSVSGSGTVVIDMTEFINSDNDILLFDGAVKKRFSLAQLFGDRSYIESVRSFASNIEIRTVKTYNRATSNPMQGMLGAAPGGPATYELNSSMLLLPKQPMKARHFDARVGYFATGYTDFDADPHGVKRVSMITRWRLEPREEDKARYLAGELVEPRKQIVFYIDPSTPRKWVPYLIAGVNDWNSAFEQAGWKNAIIAREAPGNDTGWSIDDARHSAIVYKPSDIPNASGPHVHDPRSGEILETHVNWYHNVMSLLRNWYFIQASAVDPAARTLKMDDELMGQLIRFVSSHEVGHTLGLRHNFGSSSTVPVEKLRDRKWLEENGHTPSIMDYARFNYVAQPEDSISQAGLFPRIGDYDKWAIEWGYRWFPDFATIEEEKQFLNKWAMDRISGNKRLIFGTEGSPSDPRNQSEDLGDNAMLAGEYGIKNLKRILSNLLQWTTESGEDYRETKTMYGELVSQFGRYMGHVARNIGGVYITPVKVGEEGSSIAFVPESFQKDAMRFLDRHLFTTPTWLLDKKIFAMTGAGEMADIASLQHAVLNRLLSNTLFSQLLMAESFDNGKAYTVQEMLRDLKLACWKELTASRPVDMYRRNLQKIYVERLITLIKPPPTSGNPGNPGNSQGLNKTNDALSIVKGHIRNLISDIRIALTGAKDMDTKLHLQDMKERLSAALVAEK